MSERPEECADTVRIVKGQSTSQPFEIWARDSSRTDSIVATATGYVPSKVTLTPEPVSLLQGGLPADHEPAEAPALLPGRSIPRRRSDRGWRG